MTGPWPKHIPRNFHPLAVHAPLPLPPVMGWRTFRHPAEPNYYVIRPVLVGLGEPTSSVSFIDLGDVGAMMKEKP